MITKQLIALLKELDPTGNNRIALLHRDEYLSEEFSYIKKINANQLKEYMTYIDNQDDFDGLTNKEKIILICPFNDYVKMMECAHPNENRWAYDKKY